MIIQSNTQQFLFVATQIFLTTTAQGNYYYIIEILNGQFDKLKLLSDTSLSQSVDRYVQGAKIVNGNLQYALLGRTINAG